MKTNKSNAGRKPIPDRKIQVAVCIKKSRLDLIGKSYLQQRYEELTEEIYISKGGKDAL